MSEREPSHWHLDKKVPIALIFTILVQTFAAGWFAANINARLTIVENRQTERAAQAERLAGLEATMQGVKEDVRDIKDILRTAFGRTDR